MSTAHTRHRLALQDWNAKHSFKRRSGRIALRETPNKGFSRMCALHRFIYELAENAEEAWELMEELDADGIEVIVIVSDWLMPGTRDEFLIQIHQRFPQVVKVMLTGQAEETAIEKAK